MPWNSGRPELPTKNYDHDLRAWLQPTKFLRHQPNHSYSDCQDHSNHLVRLTYSLRMIWQKQENSLEEGLNMINLMFVKKVMQVDVGPRSYWIHWYPNVGDSLIAYDVSWVDDTGCNKNIASFFDYMYASPTAVVGPRTNCSRNFVTLVRIANEK